MSDVQNIGTLGFIIVTLRLHIGTQGLESRALGMIFTNSLAVHCNALGGGLLGFIF